MDLLLAAGADLLRKAKDGTTALEQGNSEIIRNCMRKRTYMRKIIPRILVEEVAPKLSLALPKDLADRIAELTYQNWLECDTGPVICNIKNKEVYGIRNSSFYFDKFLFGLVDVFLALLRSRSFLFMIRYPL